MAGPRAEGTSWLRAGVCAHSIMPPPRTAGSPWGSWRLGAGCILGEGQGNGWEHRQGGVGLFVLSRAERFRVQTGEQTLPEIR